MKISALIKYLETIRKHDGDVPVCLWDSDAQRRVEIGDGYLAESLLDNDKTLVLTPKSDRAGA